MIWDGTIYREDWSFGDDDEWEEAPSIPLSRRDELEALIDAATKADEWDAALARYHKRMIRCWAVLVPDWEVSLCTVVGDDDDTGLGCHPPQERPSRDMIFHGWNIFEEHLRFLGEASRYEGAFWARFGESQAVFLAETRRYRSIPDGWVSPENLALDTVDVQAVIRDVFPGWRERVLFDEVERCNGVCWVPPKGDDRPRTPATDSVWLFSGAWGQVCHVRGAGRFVVCCTTL